MYYYQVGGLNSHTFQWFHHDTCALSEIVFSVLSFDTGQNVGDKKSSVELVLGILTTGASYLLVTENQMNAILRFRGFRRPQPPRHASAYASLSPINFHSAQELYAKLRTYEQNAKKRRSGRALGRDTSPANKMFDHYNPARASFEHQRVLWSAIQEPIDINKFGLCKLPSWIASTSFVALTTQIWRSESIEKQRKDPTILSLELASVRCIAFEREDYADKISHTLRVKIKEHSVMTNGPSNAINDETLEVVRVAELGRRLNEFFASIDSKYALLLVYDAEQTLSSLKKLGVDVSPYEMGIATLLYGEGQKQEEGESLYSNNWKFDRTHQGSAYSPRSRSRSPKRHNSLPKRSRSPSMFVPPESKPFPAPEREEGPEEGGEGDESEEEAPPPAKVHVTDVRALFLAVSKFVPGGVKSLQELTRRLGIPMEPDENECRLLIEAWKSMASGKSIDEQHVERAFSRSFATAPAVSGSKAPAAAPVVSGSSAELDRTEAESDEEADPNDCVVNLKAPQRPLNVVVGGLRPPADDFDSDDSDYD